MISRRSFLQAGSSAGTAALTMFAGDALARAARAGSLAAGRTAADIARDEFYWREVQGAFTLDRTLVNLNNGGVCPSPRVVHEALKRYLDISNQAPVYHLWQVLEPNIEAVRRGLARAFGCEPDELAITRNASEALQIVQLGLDLAAGDEVVTTNQDYPRMLDTWDQRARRDGIRVVRLSIPVPATDMGELVSRFERAITPRTRVLHFCHVVNLTGQILPVRDLCRLARARGIRTIVDGAHAFAHFPFVQRDLECDCYGTSLHKWLLAPVGTGFLYVRRDLVPSIWPLTPANERLTANIRKFEEVGTHPAAMHNAIAEALVFHESLGADRKAERLRYLKARWAEPLRAHPRVRLHTSLDPAYSCGVGCVGIEGIDPGRITAHLWDRHRLIVTPIKHDEFEGVRVTPNVYTTLGEVDLFVEVMREVADKGLPA